MSIVGEFFSFDGRIDRVGFLWRSIASGVMLGILALATLAAGALVLHPQNLLDAYDTLIVPVAVGAALLGLWSSFALGSRRLRGMGVEPLHLTPPYVALWVVNELLLQPMANLYPDKFGALEHWWQMLAWGILALLLVWPSFAEREAPPPIGEQGLPVGKYSDWRGGIDANA